MSYADIISGCPNGSSCITNSDYCTYGSGGGGSGGGSGGGTTTTTSFTSIVQPGTTSVISITFNGPTTSPTMSVQSSSSTHSSSPSIVHSSSTGSSVGTSTSGLSIPGKPLVCYIQPSSCETLSNNRCCCSWHRTHARETAGGLRCSCRHTDSPQYRPCIVMRKVFASSFGHICYVLRAVHGTPILFWS